MSRSSCIQAWTFRNDQKLLWLAFFTAMFILGASGRADAVLGAAISAGGVGPEAVVDVLVNGLLAFVALVCIAPLALSVRRDWQRVSQICARGD